MDGRAEGKTDVKSKIFIWIYMIYSHLQKYFSLNLIDFVILRKKKHPISHENFEFPFKTFSAYTSKKTMFKPLASFINWQKFL